MKMFSGRIIKDLVAIANSGSVDYRLAQRLVSGGVSEQEWLDKALLPDPIRHGVANAMRDILRGDGPSYGLCDPRPGLERMLNQAREEQNPK